jgi:aspartate/tyrosine/aromatic aminotransferase
MFSFSGLSPEQVARLRDDHGVYFVGNGRMNVAGLTAANLPQTTQAIADVLAKVTA